MRNRRPFTRVSEKSLTWRSYFKVMKDEGKLIGPFNATLHFPKFGAPAWAMNRTMYDHTKLPKSLLQICVLA